MLRQNRRRLSEEYFMVGITQGEVKQLAFKRSLAKVYYEVRWNLAGSIVFPPCL